jgi:diphosphomevalonate decarboxylase
MSVRVAAALAHSNIAVSKYWGKRSYEGNYPATPSLSITLDALTTRTRVTFDSSLRADRFTLDGQVQTGMAHERVCTLLGRVRAASGNDAFADVASRNDFPSAAGLASSASGFAALALAAVSALGLDWEVARVSDLARQSSASAARSLYGGFVELREGPPGATRDVLAAHMVAPKDHVEWRLIVAVAGEGSKAIGSTRGMNETCQVSPYYAAWLDLAPRLHKELCVALAARDFESFGAAAERSAFAMHASAIAAGIVYWNGVTLDALAAVRQLRAHGIGAFATIDAGPHVKVLCRESDAVAVAAGLRAVPGVTRVIEARAAEGAQVIPIEETS